MSAIHDTRVFIAYSHSDVTWLQRLQVHLKPTVRKHSVDLWDDTRICPGMDWQHELERALSSATIAVLLVSADFLASDFIIDNQLSTLLDGAAHRGTHILSAIVSPCLYSHHQDLARYQSANPPNRPLSAMPTHEAEQTLVKLAETIIQYASAPTPVRSGSVNDARPALNAKIGRADTSARSKESSSPVTRADAGLLEHLRLEIEQLPTVLVQLLSARNLGYNPTSLAELSRLEGAWVDEETDTHLYGTLVRGNLHHAYCHAGNNGLTGTYFDWTKVGDLWFSRFSWINGTWQGFGLHRLMAADLVQTTWWGSPEADMPASSRGTPTLWRRRLRALPQSSFPKWATDYFSTLANR